MSRFDYDSVVDVNGVKIVERYITTYDKKEHKTVVEAEKHMQDLCGEVIHDALKPLLTPTTGFSWTNSHLFEIACYLTEDPKKLRELSEQLSKILD